MIKASLVSLVFAAALVGAARAEPLDVVKLKTIPLIEVIRSAMLGDIVRIGLDETSTEAARAVAALDPKVQTLFWLAMIDNGLAEPSDLPTSMLAQSRFLPQMERALVDAGMDQKVRIMSAAPTEPGLTPAQTGWVELGNDFGDKSAFADRIVAYVDAHPAVRAWCDNARENMSDGDRLRALVTMLSRTPETISFATWPEAFRVIWAVDMYRGEVGNGGVHQYFYNASGDLAPITVPALRKVGLPKDAQIVEEGMGFFPKPYPTDTELRRKAFDRSPAHSWTVWDERLSKLTDAVDYDGFEPALVRYAKREDVLPH